MDTKNCSSKKKRQKYTLKICYDVLKQKEVFSPILKLEMRSNFAFLQHPKRNGLEGSDTSLVGCYMRDEETLSELRNKKNFGNFLAQLKNVNFKVKRL